MLRLVLGTVGGLSGTLGLRLILLALPSRILRGPAAAPAILAPLLPPLCPPLLILVLVVAAAAAALAAAAGRMLVASSCSTSGSGISCLFFILVCVAWGVRERNATPVDPAWG